MVRSLGRKIGNIPPRPQMIYLVLDVNLIAFCKANSISSNLNQLPRNSRLSLEVYFLLVRMRKYLVFI